MNRLLLLGIDAAIPTLIKAYSKALVLPNMTKLIQDGVWAEGLPVFPTHTASNWNTVATGAWPSTHGVTDMVVHMPGTSLLEAESGFYSTLCTAEQIWKTAERSGKKSILMKYIASWPPTMNSGLQVEGFGAPGGPASRPWGSSPLAIANTSCFTTLKLPNASVVTFSNADFSEWTPGPSSDITENYCKNLPPLETEIKIGPPEAALNYSIVTLSHSGDSYDSILVSKGRDARSGFILKNNQFSKWITEEFVINDKKIKGAFRMKLMSVNRPADPSFKLYVSQVFPKEGWTHPPLLAEQLFERFGPFLESISHFPYVFGWIDENTYIEEMTYQANWMASATPYLMSLDGWSLYMTQWHGIDNTQHAFLRFDKSVLTDTQSQIGDRVVQSSYEIGDRFVGKIVDSAREHSHGDDVYTFVMSDHGHVMGKRRFFINAYLYQKGLIKLKKDEKSGKIGIDWSKTLAYAPGMVHVYINLNGREPDGCVKPGAEYESVARTLVDILYDIKDPLTGQRPIALALTNQDAQFIGLSGERAGDIIVAANPIFVLDNRVKTDKELFENVKVGFPDGSIHGSQLPSVDLGEQGTIKSMFIAHGPKIKKGYVRDKPINMVDVAPTMASILGIDRPKNCEGRILYDIFSEDI